MNPNETLAVVAMDELNTLPKSHRPRERILIAHATLLRIRLQLTAAGATANAWAGHERLRAAVAAVDQLRDELLALAVEADQWRRQQEAARPAPAHRPSAAADAG